NALWLYGGAAAWPAPASSAAPADIAGQLEAPHRAGDWAGWLDALAELDRRHLKPLAERAGLPARPVQLILLGGDRRATLTLKPRGRLLSWLPAPKKNWNAWWPAPVGPPAHPSPTPAASWRRRAYIRCWRACGRRAASRTPTRPASPGPPCCRRRG